MSFFRTPSLVALCIVVMSIVMGGCQSTESTETTTPQRLSITFGGLTASTRPDSVLWQTPQASGKADIVTTTSSTASVTLPLPSGLTSQDTLWLSLWTGGILTGRLPYQLSNDTLRFLKAAAKQDIAWTLLSVRDSLATKGTAITVIQLYVQLLLQNDPRVSGFPSNAPAGISTDSVKTSAALKLLQQGSSTSALAALGLTTAAIDSLTTALTVKPVEFSVSSGSYQAAQTVTLSCKTPGAVIHYTTNDSVPTSTSATYSGAITVASSKTIKAIATKDGMAGSGLTSAAYAINIPVTQVQASSFSPDEGTYTSAQSVTIVTTTVGATIHYTTNGAVPTASSPVYTVPVPVPATMTIKAIATKDGMTPSTVTAAAYTINLPLQQVQPPTYSTDEGTYTSAQSVTISTATVGATIHYTTNGAEPTASSPVYTVPVPVPATMTIKAIATKDGMTNSTVSPAAYIINLPLLHVQAPTFSVPAGSYASTQSVTIATTTSGAAIHYTTDGAEPTAASTTYAGPIAVTASMTIRAIATKDGMTPSTASTAAYVISIVVVDPNAFIDDRDKQVYHTMTIASTGQTWMVENLNYVPTSGSSWCYDNVPDNCAKFGRLYDYATAKGLDAMYDTVTDPTSSTKVTGICPSGWHLPNWNEWGMLFSSVGGQSVAGKVLKSKEGWYPYSGTNDSGFKALPAGYRWVYGAQVAYTESDTSAYWWTSSQASGTASYGMSARMEGSSDKATTLQRFKGYGQSVRCVKD